MASTILVVDDSPTIRKVVSAILRAHDYETLVAADGQEALEILTTQSADLVLLDFVMPKMNGYQFCRELRANENLQRLPVVLMSAKGDKIRGQFVQQTGAIDAITKPFDPKALLAVLETALRKHDTAHPEPVAEEEEVQEVGLDLGSIQLSVDPVQRRKDIAGVFAQTLALSTGPALEDWAARAREHRSSLKDLYSAQLGPSRLHKLGSVLRLLETGSTGETSALSGDLSFISIAEVLQMLELQRQSGALSISNANASITVFLVKGAIALAQSGGLPLTFRLGRYLIQNGLITREELTQLLTEQQHRLVGEALVHLGKATEEQIRTALEHQTSELIYEAVRWRVGRFMFVSEASCPEATLAQLRLAPGGLLMEGFRRVDEWQLIEGTFDFDDVLTKDQKAIERLSQSSELTEQEREVLGAVDGERTVRQLLDGVNFSTFEVCKMLYQFLNARIVRRDAA